MGWMQDVFLAYRQIRASGVGVTVRQALNFTGSGVVVSDDQTNGQTTVTITSGGGSAPTGTGIAHVSAGAFVSPAALIVDADVDPAAAIAASKVVQASGTGIPHVVAGVLQAASSLIVNADVNAAAAIAGSKVVPTFGAQAVTGASYDINAAGFLTVGGVATSLAISTSSIARLTFQAAGTSCNFGDGYSVGMGSAANVAATGALRFPGGGTQQIAILNNAKTVNLNCISTTAGDAMVIGQADGSLGTLSLKGANVIAMTATGGVFHVQGNNGALEWFNVDATAIHGTLPYAGDAASAKPYQLLSVAIAATVGTLTAAQYQCPVIRITSGVASTLVFPNAVDGTWLVVNTSGASQTLNCGAGTAITLLTAKAQWMRSDGATNLVPLGGQF
jgi:hypothetical protein